MPLSSGPAQTVGSQLQFGGVHVVAINGRLCFFGSEARETRDSGPLAPILKDIAHPLVVYVVLVCPALNLGFDVLDFINPKLIPLILRCPSLQFLSPASQLINPAQVLVSPVFGPGCQAISFFCQRPWMNGSIPRIVLSTGELGGQALGLVGQVPKAVIPVRHTASQAVSLVRQLVARCHGETRSQHQWGDRQSTAATTTLGHAMRRRHAAVDRAFRTCVASVNSVGDTRPQVPAQRQPPECQTCAANGTGAGTGRR